jgi:Cu/Ag efflux pump CusA
MIRAFVTYALDHRFIILALTVLLLLWGAISFHNLPVEAYPDVGLGAPRKRWSSKSQSRSKFR